MGRLGFVVQSALLCALLSASPRAFSLPEDAANLAVLEARFATMASQVSKALEPMARGACVAGTDRGESRRNYAAALRALEAVSTGVRGTLKRLRSALADEMQGAGRQNRAFAEVGEGVAERRAQLEEAEARLRGFADVERKLGDLLTGISSVVASDGECTRKLAAAHAGLLVGAGQLQELCGKFFVMSGG